MITEIRQQTIVDLVIEFIFLVFQSKVFVTPSKANVSVSVFVDIGQFTSLQDLARCKSFIHPNCHCCPLIDKFQAPYITGDRLEIVHDKLQVFKSF